MISENIQNLSIFFHNIVSITDYDSQTAVSIYSKITPNSINMQNVRQLASFPYK